MYSGRLRSFRLVLVAAMVAAKYHDDNRVSDKDYQKIGGLKSLSELITLEFDLLQSIEFDLLCDRDTFNEVLTNLMV